MAGLLVLVVAVGAWWLLDKCGGADESLPAGAEDWTCAIRNPQCDADSLDVWTSTHGGRPLEEDGTLAYFMKDFDVIDGCPIYSRIFVVAFPFVVHQLHTLIKGQFPALIANTHKSFISLNGMQIRTGRNLHQQDTVLIPILIRARQE